MIVRYKALFHLFFNYNNMILPSLSIQLDETEYHFFAESSFYANSEKIMFRRNFETTRKHLGSEDFNLAIYSKSERFPKKIKRAIIPAVTYVPSLLKKAAAPRSLRLLNEGSSIPANSFHVSRKEYGAP